jgi:F0F1-type ATP synthase membrane subunit c/vacuolar-type H+-ATPase subunit K
MTADLEKIHLAPRYRATMTIVMSFVATVFVYTLVAYILTLSSSLAPARSDTGGIEQALYGAAFLLGISVVLLRRTWFNTPRLTRIVEDKGLRRLVDELSSKTIVLSALGEAVALLGLVLSLITRSFEPMLRLGIVGVILMLYTLPRRSVWEKTVRTFSRFAVEEQ